MVGMFFDMFFNPFPANPFENLFENNLRGSERESWPEMGYIESCLFLKR